MKNKWQVSLMKEMVGSKCTNGIHTSATSPLDVEQTFPPLTDQHVAVAHSGFSIHRRTINSSDGVFCPFQMFKMPKAVNNSTTAPAKGVVKKRKRVKTSKKKMKELKKQIDESYTLLLGRMLFTILQEIEDDTVRQVRANMDEFRHIISDGVASDPLDGVTLEWSEIPNAAKEAWRVFLAGDKSNVWKTFISGFSHPVPVETTEAMVSDPDQSYYDQCVVEGQSQEYDVLSELDTFFETLNNQPPRVDTPFSQVAEVPV